MTIRLAKTTQQYTLYPLVLYSKEHMYKAHLLSLARDRLSHWSLQTSRKNLPYSTLLPYIDLPVCQRQSFTGCWCICVSIINLHMNWHLCTVIIFCCWVRGDLHAFELSKIVSLHSDWREHIFKTTDHYKVKELKQNCFGSKAWGKWNSKTPWRK